MTTKAPGRIGTRREVLLIEIERRCALCGARNFVGLTRQEARSYRGFRCERCEGWTPDGLHERDAPEWWDDLCANRDEAAGGGSDAL